MHHVHLAPPTIDLLFTVLVCFWKKWRSSLASANIEHLGFVHLPFSCKHLLIVPCAWFVASIVLGSSNSHGQYADILVAGPKWVSLELNEENRHRLMNVLTMVSLQISAINSSKPVADFIHQSLKNSALSTASWYDRQAFIHCIYFIVCSLPHLS